LSTQRFRYVVSAKHKPRSKLNDMVPSMIEVAGIGLTLFPSLCILNVSSDAQPACSLYKCGLIS
jgi:hypothetical protein